ncbi:Protein DETOXIFICATION 45 like [Actinidia chinensis var. chinensis]|uniref:Protein DETOXIFICATION n=1 Tax=Actinidia chinensis var. chinensis TaxID=1590841 RepID=A0A2R6RNJ1_ACTCC|nr:Protein DETOXIFICATION 45 like [Actinidia chinensis var. chinensis]
MSVAQLIGGTLSGGLTSRSSEWNNINKMTGSFFFRQPKGPCNFVSLVDRNRLSHGCVFGYCSLYSNHRTMPLSSRLVCQRRHNLSVVNNQLGSDCGVHSSSFVDENSAIEDHLMNSIEASELTENHSCQPRAEDVKYELIMLSLPAIAGQAIEPLAQLMETAYIGGLGPVELASAGVSMSIFNIISKLFNIPLLSVATSFVAEDISKVANKISTSGEGCQQESGNGKTFDGLTTRQQLSSVSTALLLAVGIGIFEALALSLGSGLFLNLMGISPDSSMRSPAQKFLLLRALGAPAVVVSLALQGIFRGFKDTKTPVLCLGVGSFSAIFLFPMFIYYFQLGATGAAISTVISQYIVTFLMIWHLNKRAVLLPPKLRELQFGGYVKSDRASFLHTLFTSLGGFLLGRTLAVLVTMTLGTSMAARQGPVAMAAHQICLQVWLAVSLLTDALAASGQTLIASSLSKGDYRTSRDVTNFVLKIGLLTGVSLAAILGVSFGSLATLFTKDAEVLGVVRTGILFVSASQPVNALAFIYDGLHYGVSDFPYSACSMMVVGAISSAFLLYVPLIFGLRGVWSGLALFMALRTAAGYIRLSSKNGPWWFLHGDLKEIRGRQFFIY